MGLPELSAVLAIPKPTVFRLCQRLEQDGYLEREPGGRQFNVGSSLARLGFATLNTSSAKLKRQAILKALVESVGETCNFTTLAGSEVLYLARVETRWPLRLHLEPGSRVPIHCTASGKLFLADLSQDRRTVLLGPEPFMRHTPTTMTTRKVLDAHLEDIATQDYSIDDEEFLLGLVAVAVPIRSSAGITIAALACHAPVSRMPVADLLQRLPQLQAAAVELQATLPLLDE